MTEGGKTHWVRSSYSGGSNVIMSCLTCSTQSVWLRNTRSVACQWQTRLPNAIADNTFLLNQPYAQHQLGIGGSTVEKPAETQTSIMLANHLVRLDRLTLNPEESPVWRDIGF